MDNISKHIGKTIREYRKSQGLSQEKLAERVGTKHTDIGKLERGERNVTLRTLERVAQSLGIEVYQLFEDEKRSKLTRKEYLMDKINQTLSNVSDNDLEKLLSVLDILYDDKWQKTD